jgi:hypothetical protein
VRNLHGHLELNVPLHRIEADAPGLLDLLGGQSATLG